MAKLKGMFNGFWRYRYLLWNLVSRDFKLKYRRSVLGVLWSVLNPLLMCLVYWAVFSSLMDMRGSGIDNFPVFLMCGQLLFNFFNEATSSSMSSVLSAAPLLKKVYIPKYIFPLEKCCFAMVNCVFSFVALALACRWLVKEGYIGRMPIKHYVAGVSAGIVDDTAVLDLPYSEDSRAQVDLNCIMNEQGEIIEIQGTGEGRAFTVTEQQELVALCAKGNRELIAKQKEIVGDILR